MLTILAAALALAQPASEPSEEEFADLMRRTAVAAERSADAAERSARAAEAAAGIAHEEAPKADAKKPPMFTGTAGASFVALTGNSNAFTGGVNIGLNFLLGKWTLGVKSLGQYGRAKASQPDSVFQDNALNISAELKAARSFTDVVGVYVLGGYGMDHIAKIDYRAYGELGAEFTFFKRVEGDFVKMQLVADLGFRYQRESWYNFYPSEEVPAGPLENPTPNIVAVKVGVDFRYAVNKAVVFNEALQLLPDILTPENFTMQSVTGMNVKLVGPLSLAASFTLKFDNLPPPGAQKLDTVLAVGAEVVF